MNRSLLSSQCIRLLKSGDIKSVSHVDYWMGPLLSSIFPNLGLKSVPRSTPEYFSLIADCLATLMIDKVLTHSTALELTNRKIYSSFLKLEEPKIVKDFQVKAGKKICDLSY